MAQSCFLLLSFSLFPSSAYPTVGARERGISLDKEIMCLSTSVIALKKLMVFLCKEHDVSYMVFLKNNVGRKNGT